MEESSMSKKSAWLFTSLIVMLAMVLAACQPAATPVPTAVLTKAAAPTTAPTAAPATAAPTVAPTKAPTAAPTVAPTAAPAKELGLGLLMVGPYNDKGWSQAHYDGAKYAETKVAGVKLNYLDKVNPADRAGTTAAQLAKELVTKGAKVVDFSSDDMKDDAIKFAKENKDVWVIFASGDTSWKEGKGYVELPNMINVMGRMEYGKMIGGCAAALTTQTGKIGYIGPLINDETRRLAASVYLGAKYCWTKYMGKKAEDLKFKVTWIGFWFNIPGVTSDPSQVAKDFINSGYDVVVSGIDTTEGLVEVNKAAATGKKVWAVAYDFKDGCKEADKVCLGVPYFNWGPAYTKYLTAIQNGTAKSTFEWLAPDWKNINNPDTSIVGFNKGGGLSADASANVDKFITELGAGLNLFAGPLNYQDKTAFLKDGEKATDLQIWYLPQLLEGMEGQSVPSK
jgi:simple sugar transport system substrate-binding protein